MSTISETVGAKSQMASGLAQGIETLSNNETVTFTLYVKMILPLDGYIFWVNSNLLNDSAIHNVLIYGQGEYNNQGEFPALSKNITRKGSFHFAQDARQLEDRTAVFSQVIFTSESLIQDFNEIDPNLMYIANYQDMRFAFNRKENYYKQADLYHYRGEALYSVMTTQIIDTMAGFDPESVIVSNSLPIWLAFNHIFGTIFWLPPYKFFPLYPSYLVAQNINPPYASVDVTSTTALQSFPRVDRCSNPHQLVKDVVKITIYGARNNDALNFCDYVFQYSLDTDNFGIMNTPVIQDEKLTQSEMGIIAQKKSITFEISYYQTTVNNVARKLIESAFCSFVLVG